MADAGSVCPSDDTLTKLARGELGAGEARRHEEHVKGCAGCRRVLTALSTVLATHLHPTLTTPVGRAPSQPAPAPLATPPVVDTDQHVFGAPAERFVSPRGLVELGRGGLGRVLQVLDRGLEREVAVKEILEVPEAVRPNVERRFIREARLAAQLEHPGIVPVYDLGRASDGRLFYAMRRIEGTTLAERIAQAKTLAERLALIPNVLTVCQAVAYAHSRGVVHRDIKPQNVMIGAFGETLLLDWGLARAQGEPDQRPVGVDSDDARMTRAGQAVGTPAYLSPEQAKGDLAAIDEKSDQWALGALLYHAVTGRPPYADLTVDAVLAKAVTGQVLPVDMEAPEVPRELAAIVSRALAPAKPDRYADVRALAKDLTAYLAGRRVAAYDYSTLERVRRFVSRYRVPVAVAATACVVLLGAGLAAYLRLEKERDEYRRLSAVVISKGITSMRHTPGSRPVVAEIASMVQQSLSRIGSFLEAPVQDREHLAEAAAMAGAMHYESNEYEESAASHRLAAALGDSIAAERQTAHDFGQSATQHVELALALYRLTGYGGAQPELERAQAALAKSRLAGSDDLETLKAETLVDSAQLEIEQSRGDYAALLPLAEQSIDAERRYDARRPVNATCLYNEIIGMQQLADVARLAGKPERARGAIDEGLKIEQRLETSYPGTNDYLEGSYELRRAAAAVERDTGHPAEALAHLAEARRRVASGLESEPTNLSYREVLLRVDLMAGDTARLNDDVTRLCAIPGFERSAATLMNALLVLWSPAEIVAFVDAHPKLLADPTGQYGAGLAAALAQKPARAAALIEAAVTRGEPYDDWQPHRLAAHLPAAGGPELALVRRLVDALDATEVPRDEARRREAFRAFASGLRTLGTDAGAPR